MVYLLGWVWDSQLCWRWLAYVTASLRGWPLGRHQSNGLILQVMSIFLFESFISSIFNCLCIVRKHLAPIYCSITLANLQTFYQSFVFNGKTHIINTEVWRQHDVTSTKKYLTFSPVEYLFRPKYFLQKFGGNLNIFREDIKENVSGWFFSEHSVV